MRSTSALLRKGPGPQVHFLAGADSEQIAETITAFANSEGGTLVLGIDAQGEFGDIVMEDEIDNALQASLRHCLPPVKTSWQQEQVHGHTIVSLQVDRSAEVHTLDDGRILVRKGSKNVPADQRDLELLMASRPSGDFELQPVPGATLEDLDDDVDGLPVDPTAAPPQPKKKVVKKKVAKKKVAKKVPKKKKP